MLCGPADDLDNYPAAVYIPATCQKIPVGIYIIVFFPSLYAIFTGKSWLKIKNRLSAVPSCRRRNPESRSQNSEACFSDSDYYLTHGPLEEVF